MNRYIIYTFFLLSGTLNLRAQESLSLNDCILLAESNHRLSEEKDRYETIFDLSSAILKKVWMPDADAGAGYIYNSDVVDLRSALAGIPIPGLASAISPIPHSQYRLTVDINQMIYDGGATKELIKAKESEMKINQQLADIEVYGIRERVIDNFYSIILLDSQYELLNSFAVTLELRIKAVATAIETGMMTPSDYDILLAEKYKLLLRADENRILSATLRSLLSDIAGIDIDDSTTLIPPAGNMIPAEPDLILARPELKLFDIAGEQLNAGEKLIEAVRRPKAFGFATIGYGNPPGNNFFKDSFEPYFIAGASLKWNIYDWNRAKHEKEIINVRKEISETRRSDTEIKILRQLEMKRGEIARLEKAIQTGDTLIELHTGITAAITSRFVNGTITAYEYLAGTNAEQEAVIAREISRISLEKAKAEYRFISGLELK
jgi:outer membrane protein TolC